MNFDPFDFSSPVSYSVFKEASKDNKGYSGDNNDKGKKRSWFNRKKNDDELAEKENNGQ